jgi:hypothetical protein
MHMSTKRIVAGMVIGMVTALLSVSRSNAWGQCPGRVTAIGNDWNDSLAVIVNPEQDCGCYGNRLVLLGTNPGRRGIHADALTALVTGMRVSVGYDHDASTAPFCNLTDISLIP